MTIQTEQNNAAPRRMASLLESAAYWAGVAAVTLTGLAAVTGIFAWYFSDKVATQRKIDFDHFREKSAVDIAQANERAAEANKIAEEERLARVKLESKLAPRTLKGESQNAVVAAIKQFAPQTFDILWYSDDPESTNLANDIFAAFQRAGWKVDRPSESWLGFGVQLGVIIEFTPEKKDELASTCKTLADAFVKEGIVTVTQPKEREDKERKPTTLVIRVAKKP